MNDTKTKIVYVVILGLVMGFGSFVSLHVIAASNASPLVQAPSNTEPQVLGAYTTTPIRGELTSVEIKKPILTNEIDSSDIAAKSFLVYDQETGDIIVEKNSSEKLSIASLTKLMTGLVAYNTLDLNNYSPVPVRNYVKETPSLRVRAGEEIKPLDLLSAMLIGSVNDAAQTLGAMVEEKTGKDFVDLMNQKAQELGMKDTEFSNPMGFSSYHNFSTARDLINLVNETQKYPAFLNVGRQTKYSFSDKDGDSFFITATNKLIKNHNDITAIKTGYTQEALGAMITKTTVKGRNLIIIILGSTDREGDTLKLKDKLEQALK